MAVNSKSKGIWHRRFRFFFLPLGSIPRYPTIRAHTNASPTMCFTKKQNKNFSDNNEAAKSKPKEENGSKAKPKEEKPKEEKPQEGNITSNSTEPAAAQVSTSEPAAATTTTTSSTVSPKIAIVIYTMYGHIAKSAYLECYLSFVCLIASIQWPSPWRVVSRLQEALLLSSSALQRRLHSERVVNPRTRNLGFPRHSRPRSLLPCMLPPNRIIPS